VAKCFKYLLDFIFIVAWLAGVVLAHGGFKFLAFFFPPYALYLVVERLMEMANIIP